MKKRLLWILSLGVMLLCSCNKPLLDETRTMPGNKWLRFEPEQFDFDIKNVEDCYHIVFTIRIDTTLYTAKTFPLVVNMQTDAGEHRMFYSNIKLKDAQGHRTGEMTGAYQNTEGRIREYVFFNSQGKVHLAVKQGTTKYELPGVASVGLRVEKAQMKIPQ